MDSIQSLAQLKAFREATAGNLAAIDTALSLIQDGYTTDQSRIDTEIQAGKDAVANEISALNATLTDKENAIDALQTERETLRAEKDAIIADLQAQTADSTKIADPVVEMFV